MLTTTKISLALITGVAAFALPLAILAFESSENFTLKVTPGSPGPNESVIAKVESYSTDLDGATIIWSINNKIVASGIGNKKINFTTGPVNSAIRLQVNVTTVTGGNLSRSLTIFINDIDLLWHADSYTPPQYLGKGLLATKSALTVTAIPHLYRNGKKLSPDSLIYEWRLDDWNEGEKSGYGRQSFSFIADGFSVHREHHFELSVFNQERTLQATKEIFITPGTPETEVYEYNALLGPLLRRAVTNFSAAAGAARQFIAVPYYFALADDPNALDYFWSANGKKEAAPEKKYFFDFSSTINASGRVNVSLRITNPLRPTQSAGSDFNINVE